MTGIKIFISVMIGMMVAGAQASQKPATDFKSDEAILARQYEALDLKNQTPSEVLLTILTGTDISCGIMMLQSEYNEPKYSLVSPSGWTLRQILDYLTSGATPYKWRIDNGVINLVPRGSLPALLNVRIAKFDFEDADNWNLLVQRLQELPEIRERASELGLEWAPFQGGLSVYYPPGQAPLPRPVHLRNITLLEGLNQIATIRGGGVWRYIQETEHGKTQISIIF